jgi:hypothetical protein
MLISDKLIYVELQKTGSTAVPDLLKKIVGGTKETGNKPEDDHFSAGKPVLGSVRDPWSWYLSMWSYGCLQKGELYERLTNPKKWSKVLDDGKDAKADDDGDEGDDDADDEVEGDEAAAAAETSKGGKKKAKKSKALPEGFTPERARTFWYANPDNADAFREWLRAVLAVQPLRKVLESGYGKSPISKLGGLMTFRYFSLFTKGGDKLDKSVDSLDGLKEFDEKHGLVTHFIRDESVSKDLLKALEACGYTLEGEQRKAVKGLHATPASTRPHPLEYYYDADSVQLVMRREKFIVEKFKYKNRKPGESAAPTEA